MKGLGWILRRSGAFHSGVWSSKESFANGVRRYDYDLNVG